MPKKKLDLSPLDEARERAERQARFDVAFNRVNDEFRRLRMMEFDGTRPVDPVRSERRRKEQLERWARAREES